MLACISGCRGVIGFTVGTWLCPVREKVHPAWADVGASAKKFALRAQKGPQSAVCGVLGEFFVTMPLEGLRWANFVSHKARYASCWAKNVSPTGAAIRLVAHAATSTPTARLECAVKLVARGYCTTWGAIALLCC